MENNWKMKDDKEDDVYMVVVIMMIMLVVMRVGFIIADENADGYHY